MHHVESILALIALALAYTFDFVNGFHDTANAVATVIYTKAMRAPAAIFMSALLNFCGCLLVGTAVAQVITEVIPRQNLSLPVFLAVLLGGLGWNLYTWYRGIPVSSSHCLVGSLFGAGIAAGGIQGVSWTPLISVLIALVLSPVLGFLSGMLIAALASKLVEKVAPGSNQHRHHQPPVMRWLQIASSAALSFTHGSNDGQKTMGIIALILATSFPSGGFTYDHIPLWVMVTAAAAIALGTMIGGWRVIRTVGTRISREKLLYTHGFAAEFSTALIVFTGSLFGWPVSTTHTLTSAVAGGTIPLHGVKAVNLRMLKYIFSAWWLTLPVSFLLSALCYCLLKMSGLP